MQNGAQNASILIDLNCLALHFLSFFFLNQRWTFAGREQQRYISLQFRPLAKLESCPISTVGHL